MTLERDGKLDALRREFDQVFAAPPPLEAEIRESLIVLGLGEASVALRLSEIKGLHALPPLMPLPAASPGLLGLAGFRGKIVPTYDLSALLGQGEGDRPRWMVLYGETLRGLAFTEVREHLHVLPDEIHAPGPQAPPWSAGILTVRGHPCQLLHLPHLISVARPGRETIRKDG